MRLASSTSTIGLRDCLNAERKSRPSPRIAFIEPNPTSAVFAEYAPIADPVCVTSPRGVARAPVVRPTTTSSGRARLQVAGVRSAARAIAADYRPRDRRRPCRGAPGADRHRRRQALLLPENFLPAAERHGLMPRIDRVMVEHAAALASCGRAVHVNLSATTIADERLLRRRPRHGSPARRGPAADHVRDHRDGGRRRHAAAPLASPRGSWRTGSGSRSTTSAAAGAPSDTCRTLPVSIIKIDREFIRDLCANPKTIETRARHGRARRRARPSRRSPRASRTSARSGTADAGSRLRAGLLHRSACPGRRGLGLGARRRLHDLGLLPRVTRRPRGARAPPWAPPSRRAARA